MAAIKRLGLEIPIADIDPEPASLMRHEVNCDVVNEYAEIFDKLPPIELLWDPVLKKWWLVDGYHRYLAAKKLGRTTIIGNRVGSGDLREAWFLATQANLKHGMRPSELDKRDKVIHTAERENILNTSGNPWSQQELADHCHVGVGTVNRALQVMRSHANSTDVIFQVENENSEEGFEEPPRKSPRQDIPDGYRVNKRGQVRPQEYSKAPTPRQSRLAAAEALPAREPAEDCRTVTLYRNDIRRTIDQCFEFYDLEYWHKFAAQLTERLMAVRGK
jgi:hypothetical protein